MRNSNTNFWIFSLFRRNCCLACLLRTTEIEMITIIKRTAVKQPPITNMFMHRDQLQLAASLHLRTNETITFTILLLTARIIPCRTCTAVLLTDAHHQLTIIEIIFSKFLNSIRLMEKFWVRMELKMFSFNICGNICFWNWNYLFERIEKELLSSMTGWEF